MGEEAAGEDVPGRGGGGGGVDEQHHQHRHSEDSHSSRPNLPGRQAVPRLPDAGPVSAQHLDGTER